MKGLGLSENKLTGASPFLLPPFRPVPSRHLCLVLTEGTCLTYASSEWSWGGGEGGWEVCVSHVFFFVTREIIIFIGPIPAELGLLENLQELDLCSNEQLTGTSPLFFLVFCLDLCSILPSLSPNRKPNPNFPNPDPEPDP
jgi:hypothetical protein